MDPSIWQFKNGCRVIHEEKKCADKSTLLVCCNVGSIHETKETSGYCHLLEHLLLVSGTENASYHNIFHKFDITGSEFNAYTTKTQTVFSVTCLTEYLNEFLVIFGYLIFTSKIGTRVEKEQSVIKQENLSDENQSNYAVYDIFEAQVFNNTPFQNPIDKNDKSKRLNLELLMQFYKTYYVPGNLSLSIVSGLPSDKILFFLKQSHFFTMPRTDVKIHPTIMNQPMVNPGYSVVSKNTETTSLMLGFSIPIYEKTEICLFEVLKYYLNRMDGVLFNYFRTTRGSAYRFNADIDEEEVGGYFSINVETTPKNVENILKFCVSTFRSLIRIGIPEKDLIDVKKYIKKTLRLKYLDTAELADYNMKQISSLSKDKIVPFCDIYKKYYHPIQNFQINNIIRKHFITSQMVVSIVGKNVPAHSVVEKICASLA